MKTQERKTLRPKLCLWTATTINVGATIGARIFGIIGVVAHFAAEIEVHTVKRRFELKKCGVQP